MLCIEWFWQHLARPKWWSCDPQSAFMQGMDPTPHWSASYAQEADQNMQV